MPPIIRRGLHWLVALSILLAHPVQAQPAEQEVLFRDVRVFDGTSDELSPPTNVLVRGNIIAAIGPRESASSTRATVIEGRGQTLMPGLIDNHVHMMFNSLTAKDMSLSTPIILARSAAQSRPG
jgi:imidazolonepropionase-like amidohydrolase